MEMMRAILDTRGLVHQLRTDLARLNNADYDIHTLMDQLFWCLESKQDMEGRLQQYFDSLFYEAIAVSKDPASGEIAKQDLMIYQVALLKVLSELNRQLDNAQLFDEHGVLQYRYERMFIDDVLLIHNLAPIAGEGHLRERVNS